MTLELNRRTFLALIGASTAAVTVARPARSCSPASNTMPQGSPRCFMAENEIHLPSRPKTAAITYLLE